MISAVKTKSHVPVSFCPRRTTTGANDSVLSQKLLLMSEPLWTLPCRSSNPTIQRRDSDPDRQPRIWRYRRYISKHPLTYIWRSSMICAPLRTLVTSLRFGRAPESSTYPPQTQESSRRNSYPRDCSLWRISRYDHSGNWETQKGILRSE